MPYFMIHIHAEKDSDERGFEVRAVNSGCALLRMLIETGSVSSEKLLHSIHIGAPYDAPISPDAVAEWPIEDQGFVRLH